MLGTAQSVVNEIHKRGRVALHQKLHVGILLAQLALAAYVLVEPRIVNYAEVGSGKAAVKLVAADAAPCGVMVSAKAMEAGLRYRTGP